MMQDRRFSRGEMPVYWANAARAHQDNHPDEVVEEITIRVYVKDKHVGPDLAALEQRLRDDTPEDQEKKPCSFCGISPEIVKEVNTIAQALNRTNARCPDGGPNL